MKNFISKVIQNNFVVRFIQILIAYIGWNITAVTIVNSSMNSIGLFLIILAIFLSDIVKGSFWLYNKFKKIKNL